MPGEMSRNKNPSRIQRLAFEVEPDIRTAELEA